MAISVISISSLLKQIAEEKLKVWACADTLSYKVMYTNSNNFNPERKDFCIFSYNSWGFHDGNQSICKDLLKIAGNKIPIICNQENFLSKANKFKIEQCLPDHHNPANKERLSGKMAYLLPYQSLNLNASGRCFICILPSTSCHTENRL